VVEEKAAIFFKNKTYNIVSFIYPFLIASTFSWIFLKFYLSVHGEDVFVGEALAFK